ncbi:hypothetical protein DRE_01257 [Drechslerella stenobrocha 248]|uniref:Uncharacterized protein n=1 Tax=Drechslerella stenobrocha 248 TaxID=1043628 RepID=W7I577_9PEZI|nr:hypothetical protein DRE_01257 [Drechslerella stenobrocha 248]
MVLCHAHAQLDDSFDEEFEVANYNLAQVAELDAASRRHHHKLVPAASLTQSPVSHHSSDPMQLDSIAAPSTIANLPSFHHSRKLKRSCDYGADASGSKRTKQVAF